MSWVDAIRGMGRAPRALLLVSAATLALVACASHSDDPAIQAEREAANDPLEPMNRYFFEVNRFLDQIALRPVAEIYAGVTPDPAERAVTNFLDNLDEPVTALNDLLQGEPSRAGVALARFGVNSTVGIGGLLDVAEDMGLAHHQEDFGQTLGVWGVGEGPYLVLPLLGPRPPRDLAGFVVDQVTDPWGYVFAAVDAEYLSYARTGANIVDARARNLQTLDDIERNSIDYYTAIRSLYRQRRDSAIRNGAPDLDAIPDISAAPEPGPTVN